MAATCTNSRRVSESRVGRWRIVLLATLLMSLALSACRYASAEATHADEIEIDVRLEHGQVIVDAQFTVAASLQEAWAVLTDFDHMAEFISNLRESRVVSQPGEPLRVEQKGRAARGLLAFSFESIREVQLLPFESIRTRLISGNLKKLEGYTRLERDGERTRIVFHGESIPSVWVPPAIGPAFIKRETREQFEEMRAEILRRKRSSS